MFENIPGVEIFNERFNADREDTVKKVQVIEYIVEVHKELHGNGIQDYAIVNDVKRRAEFKDTEVKWIEMVVNFLINPPVCD